MNLGGSLYIVIPVKEGIAHAVVFAKVETRYDQGDAGKAEYASEPTGPLATERRDGGEGETRTPTPYGT